MRETIPFKGVSMSPLIREGDELIKSEIQSLNLGDIIILKDRDHELICHRVINISPLETKGDRSLYKDLDPKAIYKVQYIKRDNKFIRVDSKFFKSILTFLNNINQKEKIFRKTAVLFIIIIHHIILKTSKEINPDHI